VLLSQDEARFTMVPTLTRTLGVKGHRPVVGSWDCKDVVQAFAAVNLVSGRLVGELFESATKDRRKDGSSKTGRMQEAFAEHLRHIAQSYPVETCTEVILMLDNAPWHRGKAITKVLETNPHLKLYRLPSYSPQLNPIERLWKKLRWDVTHNRLFESLRTLSRALARRLRRFTRSPLSLLRTIAQLPKSPAP
jgi:transposase